MSIFKGNQNSRNEFVAKDDIRTLKFAIVNAPSEGSFALVAARATYDFAADGGVVGAITPKATARIPDNAILVGGTINSTTAVLGSSSTVSIGTTVGSSATSILSATAEASLSADAVLNTAVTFASPVKMTAEGYINVTVGNADLTAGVIDMTVIYYVARS